MRKFWIILLSVVVVVVVFVALELLYKFCPHVFDPQSDAYIYLIVSFFFICLIGFIIGAVMLMESFYNESVNENKKSKKGGGKMEINTVLLITLDKSGEVMALIQSGIVPFPRIIQVRSPEALEEAWNNQKNGEIFYNSIYSISINEELKKKKDELGIKDGVYQK